MFTPPLVASNDIALDPAPCKLVIEIVSVVPALVLKDISPVEIALTLKSPSKSKDPVI